MTTTKTKHRTRKVPSAVVIAANDAKIKDLHEKLAEQVQAVHTGEDWTRWLNAANRFPTRSHNNSLLIVSQCPEATVVLGYNAWQDLGRQVIKGEHGLKIFAPTYRKAKADVPDADAEPTRTRPARWRIVNVFDISQTSGKPLPEPPTPALLQGEAPDGLWDDLAYVVAAQHFTLDRGDCGPANGVTNIAARTVRVRDDIDPAQAVRTLAHELAHILLHGDSALVSTVDHCKGITEVEAESVAYLVTAYHGLTSDTYTFPYIASWASSIDGSTPEEAVKSTGKRVVDAARQILVYTQHDVETDETDEADENDVAVSA